MNLTHSIRPQFDPKFWSERSAETRDILARNINSRIPSPIFAQPWSSTLEQLSIASDPALGVQNTKELNLREARYDKYERIGVDNTVSSSTPVANWEIWEIDFGPRKRWRVQSVE